MKPKRNWYRQAIAVALSAVFLIFTAGCEVMKSYDEVMAPQRKKYRITDVGKPITPQEMRADLQYLVKTLEEVHPNPYTIMDKESFHKRIADLIQSLTTPLTIKEFYLKIAPLMVSLEHDHTYVQFPWDAYNVFRFVQNGKLFPFEVVIAEDKLIVKHNYSSKAIAPGAEIQSINGVPAREIIETLLQYCCGSTRYARINKRLTNDFQALLWLAYNFGTEFTIDIDGRWIPISGEPISEIQRIQNNRVPNANYLARFDYQHLGEGIGWLLVNDFQQENYTEKLETAFTEISRQKISDLIIDVRNNTGGNTTQVEQLIEYLWEKPYVTMSYLEQKRSPQYDQQLDELFYWWSKPILRLHPVTKHYFRTPVGEVAQVKMPEKNPKRNPLRFQGKVYVLIGPGNYSSGTQFVNVIKDYRIGTLIGQSTGSAANEYGNPYEFVLPNSNLWVRSATNYSIRPSGEKTTGGVPPDIEIIPTQEELDRGEDPVLDYTKKLIMTNRANNKE